MKKQKKILQIILAGIMLMSAVTPAFAATPAASGAKEEVIYINLQADGTVDDIYAVNIFGKGAVTDYGDYSAVKTLNTNDRIFQNGETVTFNASASRTYYEGKLKSKQSPWNISIEYRLNGKKYKPEELAGKSGKLEIHFTVAENSECKGNFFENYALQASFTLDTEKCGNITTSDATVANAGGNKQISYTMLPGKGIDTTITADVRDFEMPAVSVNGIPLSVNAEVDDDELMKQVSDLLDAIAELDDGAEELLDGTSDLKTQTDGDLSNGMNDLVKGAADLQNGANELKDGGEQLNDGTKSLQDGAQTLYGGLEKLNEGIALTQNGLDELNEKSDKLINGSADTKTALLEIQNSLNGISDSADRLTDLVQTSSKILTALNGLTEGLDMLHANTGFQAYKAAMLKNNLDIDALQNNNNATVAVLNKQIEQLSAVGEDTSQLKSIVLLLQGNSAAISGMDSYLTELNGSVGGLAASSKALSENYVLFDNGINDLAVSMSEMLVQMSALRSGIDRLVEKYEELDDGVNDYTGGVAKIVAGYSEISAGSADVLNGSRDLRDGTAAVYGKTGELLSGIAEFYDATGSLNDGTGKLDDGVAKLLVGIADLNDGTKSLKEGTGELRDETAGMDTDISDKIDEMLESFTGENAEVQSFVSDKNKNVSSVQFVIQTKAIEISEADAAMPEVQETLTFWQKLLRLFNLY